MKKREEMESLKKEIAELEEKSSQLQHQSFELSEKRNKVAAEIILEENLLAGTAWEFKRSGNNTVYLEYNGHIKDDEFSKVVEIAWGGWHSWFELEPGIQIRFDDSEVSIHFDDAKMLLPFAKKFNLKLSGQTIVNELRDLKRQVAALEAINHQLNLKA